MSSDTTAGAPTSTVGPLVRPTEESTNEVEEDSSKVANRQMSQKCNQLAEHYLIQGEVHRAEKILQKGFRMYPNERCKELLREIVDGRERERAAGRNYQGRGHAAVDGAIRVMFQESDAIQLDKETMDHIVQVCQGNVERGAEVYSRLQSNPGGVTKEQVLKIITGMQAMWESERTVGAGRGRQNSGRHSSDDLDSVTVGLLGLSSGAGVLGMLAHFFGSRMPIVSVLAPLGSMGCVLITVFTCYYLWRTGDNIKDTRVIFPAISELGAAMPEHRVYQVGFAMTGVLLFLHIRMFSQLVVPKLLEYGVTELQTHADQAISWGYYSACGVILQGVFTLEMKVSMQSMIHWGGAVLFMSGAMNHAQSSKALYDGALEYSDHIDVLRNDSLLSAVYVRKLILDYSTMVMFVPIILAQVFFASSPAAAPPRRLPNGEEEPAMPDPKSMNTMGVMQWAIVFQFAVYFCTYAVDLYVCVGDTMEKQKNE